MTLWLDAQLPPTLAAWFSETFGVAAFSMKYLGLEMASDLEIFTKAKAEGVVLLSKDSDFLQLLDQWGPPPQLVYLRLGNSTNVFLRSFFTAKWPEVRAFLDAGVALVEVGQK
jgi:predicted nuclease of predicted toxin-antitoxin system